MFIKGAKLEAIITERIVTNSLVQKEGEMEQISMGSGARRA